MAQVFKNLFRGSSANPQPSEDADFVDFAAPPSPAASVPSASTPLTSSQTPLSGSSPILYTKWYRVWERTSPADFKTEAVILPFIIIAVLVHLWGTRKNKRKAKDWLVAHVPAISSEFALVGFSGYKRGANNMDGVLGDEEIANKLKGSGVNAPPELLKEKTANEFVTYASGRQNVAFADFKIVLNKRYNPVYIVMEQVFGLFFDSMAPQSEHMEAVVYTFDGKEKEYVPPAVPGSEEVSEKPRSVGNSTYDGFVWAVVSKGSMKKLRDDRYDVSLTATKEHQKLPAWTTVMSESAEITDMLLTPDLVNAIEKAGDLFEYLIITDQPADKPLSLDETTPKKRLHLSLRLPPTSSSPSAYSSTLPLFALTLRLSDHLAAHAHFRPEVLRKVRTTREEQANRIRRQAETSTVEERRSAAEKIKKEERERKLRGLGAEEQRKWLEKEAARERRKGEKRVTKRA